MTKEYKVDIKGEIHLLTPSKLGYRFKFDNVRDVLVIVLIGIKK